METDLTTSAVECVPVLPTAYRVTKAVLGIVSLILVLLWCYYRVRYRRTLLVASKMYTGVPAYPIVGHLPYYFRRDYIGMVYRIGKTMMSKGEQYVCIWLGIFPLIIITRADDIHKILTSSKSAEKSLEYTFIKPGLGNGLLTSPGNIHRITRRYVNPLFTPRNLEKLIELFNDTSRHLVQDLSQFVDQDPVDIFPTVTRNALRNISRVMFGPDLEIDKYSEELEEMYQTMYRITNLMLQRAVKIWLWPDFLFHYLWSEEMKAIRKGIKNYADIPQKAYKDELSLQENHTHKSIILSDTIKNLREKHPEFTDQHWLDEVTTLATTGTDSTKVVISYCLLALALNPAIQDRLYQETISVMGVEDRDVTLQNIKDMPYLDQVFKESLRSTSAIPLVARITVEDIDLKRFTLPAGSTIVVSLVGLNNNPQVFSNPSQFDPDNFAPERAAKMERNDFTPFSSGARNCIGQTYANMFTKIAIVQVLRKYRLSSTVDINKMSYTFGITLYSDDGYHLKLEQRNLPESQ